MFDYLLNYGVEKTTFNYEDVDIDDRLQLQSQINGVRKNYHKSLVLLDDIQNKFLETQSELSRRSKELLSNNSGVRNNVLFSSDDKYVELEAKLEALKIGLSMVNSQIEYYKNDLRILNSVFYNKF